MIYLQNSSIFSCFTCRFQSKLVMTMTKSSSKARRYLKYILRYSVHRKKISSFRLVTRDNSSEGALDDDDGEDDENDSERVQRRVLEMLRIGFDATTEPYIQVICAVRRDLCFCMMIARFM